MLIYENLEAHLQDETQRKRNRADTEQRLINVALESLRTNGILAGLNLKEVAAGAGVNRGNNITTLDPAEICYGLQLASASNCWWKKSRPGSKTWVS